MAMQEIIESLEDSCKKVLKLPQIRFVGVLDKMGNKIAGGFKDGLSSYLQDKEDRMLYVQSTLEFLMRKDFDTKLGPIDYMVTRRSKLLLLTIPIVDYLVLISAERDSNVENLINKVNDAFTMLPDINP